MLAAVVLAFGLAMDAAAVAAVRGLTGGRRELVLLPLVFGAFQIGMAALGWGLGAWGGPLFAAWNHWVAFALLVLVGGKMLLEAWRGNDEEGPPERTGRVGIYLVLGIATSIDAAAAGVTLPLLAAPPWFALAVIGGVTVACSALGYATARHLGPRIGTRLEVLGGLVLIGLGVRVLVQHL